MQSISFSKPQYARVQGYFQWPRRLSRESAADRFLGLGFEFHLGHGSLFVVTVVCYKVKVSATR